MKLNRKAKLLTKESINEFKKGLKPTLHELIISIEIYNKHIAIMTIDDTCMIRKYTQNITFEESNRPNSISMHLFMFELTGYYND